MKKISINIIMLILYFISVSSVYADITGEKAKNGYFANYPSSWTEIAKDRDSIIIAQTEKHDIQVKIRHHNDQRIAINAKESRDATSLCKYDYCIDIQVNRKKIICLDSVFSDLRGLNRAKVFIEGEKAILLLDGGDAAEGYYVKVDFDEKHVIRRTVYDASSMRPDVISQETIYYQVVLYAD